MSVVASARARRQGRLDCGHRAAPGMLIYKVDDGQRGAQTVHGNGRGSWFCGACAFDSDGKPAA